MADFDPAIALQARGYSPQDAVAPLQAYMLAQQGNNLGAETTSRDIANQLAQATLSSKQQLAKTMATPGSNLLAGLTSSGMGAYDPEGAGKALSNIQAGRTQNAFDAYGQTNDPSSLAPAGPTAVREGYGASDAQQDVLAKQSNLRGRIALGYMQSVSKASSPADQDLAWHTAVGQAHAAGLIPPLTAGHAIDNITDPGQRMTIARQWAAAGADSVVNSGDAIGNQTNQRNRNDIFSVPVGTGLYAGPDLRKSMFDSTPAASQKPTTGRSVAEGGPPSAPVPVSPAGGNGSHPIAGGFLGSGDAQHPLVTRAEQTNGLAPGQINRTMQIESGGNPNARSSSGAMGLMQIMPATWAQYARPGQNPYNPADSLEVGARITADYQNTLAKALGRQPTPAETYLSYQQGPAGAAKLLANPNAPAASIIGAKALISNGGTPNMTAGQFAAMWENKFNRAGNSGNFSLSGPSPMGPGVSMPPPNPTSTLPGTGGTGLRAAAAPSPAAQPDLAPPVASPIPLPTSTQPMPADAPSPATMGRSASDAAPVPPTRPLDRGLTPLVKGMSPFEYQKQQLDASRAVDEEKSARNQFVAANTAQSGLMQLQEDLTKLDPKNSSNLRDTFLTPGSGAEARIGLAKTVNTILSTAGMEPLFPQDKITAAESAAKTTGRLGFGDAGSLGQGQAGYIVQQAIGINPGIMNTPQGSKLLIGSLLAGQQRLKDFYLFQRQYAENNGGNPIGAETMFDEHRPPMTYVQDAQRLARVPMQAYKYLQGHSDQATISAFNQKYGPSLARYYLGSRTD